MSIVIFHGWGVIIDKIITVEAPRTAVVLPMFCKINTAHWNKGLTNDSLP